jgi:prevent-host-death family protein
MNNIRVSATELANKTSEILNKVRYEGVTAIVERHGEEIARLTPPSIPEKKSWDKFFGAIPDFPDVRKDRYFRKRDLDFDK